MSILYVVSSISVILPCYNAKHEVLLTCPALAVTVQCRGSLCSVVGCGCGVSSVPSGHRHWWHACLWRLQSDLSQQVFDASVGWAATRRMAMSKVSCTGKHWSAYSHVSVHYCPVRTHTVSVCLHQWCSWRKMWGCCSPKLFWEEIASFFEHTIVKIIQYLVSPDSVFEVLKVL